VGLSQIVKSGVIKGSQLHKVFKYSKKNNFAITSINVINIETINAVLESASKSRSTIMIQINHENAKFFTGNISKGDDSVLGAINVANHVHTVASAYKIPVILTTDYVSSKNLDWLDSLITVGIEYHKVFSTALYSSYAIDLSGESYDDSLKIAKKYLKKVSKMGMCLEIKIGINYASKVELCNFYSELQKISQNFMVSFLFLDEEISDIKKLFLSAQKIVEKTLKTNSKPINFVFEGDFCTKKDLREIIDVGVVKINLDEEIKNAFCKGINNIVTSSKNSDNIATFIEPKQWLREIQKNIIKKVTSSIKDFNAKDTL
jgi:fructose-bisphosphate aldolase class II